MAILTHPLLKRLSRQLFSRQENDKHSALRWIDLYAAQYIADDFEPVAQGQASAKQAEAAPCQPGQTLDLFAAPQHYGDDCALTREDLLVLALMCSYVTSLGQTCLVLSDMPQELFSLLSSNGYLPSYSNPEKLRQGLAQLQQTHLLQLSSLQALEVDQPIKAPLVLDQDRVYLAKYWHLHQAFEVWLQSRAEQMKPLAAELLAPLGKMLRVLFNLDASTNDESAADWQAVAAAHTLINPFSLITGGPGTGKTTTAAKVLSLLIYKHQLVISNGVRPRGSDPTRLGPRLNIRLLAPTGKAAVRLADAIRFQLQDIESRLLAQGINPGRLSEWVPASGETVHRYLYERGGLRDAFAMPTAFRSDDILLRLNQSEAGPEDTQGQSMEIIVVDESSMMDLALMVELLRLMPKQTQLILMGDHYQLPAVDPGQVFADCVARFSSQQASSEELALLSQLTGFNESMLVHEIAESPPELGFQPLCVLRKTYRFDGDLKLAAEQIKEGDFQAFAQQFKAPESAVSVAKHLVWHALKQDQTVDYPAIIRAYQGYFEAVARKADLWTLVSQFETYQLLCSTLEGPLGVDALNHFIEQYFQPSWQAGVHQGNLYHGKAIMVTRNHPQLGIYNGDIGFVLEDPHSANLNAHFPAANQAVISVSPGRIREWQTAYAMTVHKSQGSEYRHVGLVLAGYAKELLTRELLYTAVTRSKVKCDIWAAEDALRRAFEPLAVSSVQTKRAE